MAEEISQMEKEIEEGLEEELARELTKLEIHAGKHYHDGDTELLRHMANVYSLLGNLGVDKEANWDKAEGLRKDLNEKEEEIEEEEKVIGEIYCKSCGSWRKDDPMRPPIWRYDPEDFRREHRETGCTEFQIRRV